MNTIARPVPGTEHTYRANRAALEDALSAAPAQAGRPRALGLELERFVIDRASGHTVAYADEPGIHALLEGWSDFFAPEEQVFIDGHLFGYLGGVEVLGERVGLSISLEPGSQLEASVGPSASAGALLGALEAFDAQFRAVCDSLGVDWELVARGFNPNVADPFDVPLIDKRRYHLMDAYLETTGGTYAQDMMRTSASTQVSIDLAGGGAGTFGARKTYQLAVALGPILSFLTDNTPRRHGRPCERPLLARETVWTGIDPRRTGLVPGTFDDGFSPADYVDWLCGIEPILFTDEAGASASTGHATMGDVMRDHILTGHERAHLLSMVFPDVRLKGFAEIRTMDSLPPAQAAAIAAFVKGLFYVPEVGDEAVSLVVDGTTENAVHAAWDALRTDGWDAVVYGHPFAELADELRTLARRGLDTDPDQALLDPLDSLWAERRLPREL